MYAIRKSPTSPAQLVHLSPRTAKLAIAGRHDQARYGVAFEPCGSARAKAWLAAGLPQGQGWG